MWYTGCGAGKLQYAMYRNDWRKTSCSETNQPQVNYESRSTAKPTAKETGEYHEHSVHSALPPQDLHNRDGSLEAALTGSRLGSYPEGKLGTTH